MQQVLYRIDGTPAKWHESDGISDINLDGKTPKGDRKMNNPQERLNANALTLTTGLLLAFTIAFSCTTA